jgi:Transposase
MPRREPLKAIDGNRGSKPRRTELLGSQMSKLAGTLFARLEPSPLPPGLIPSAKRAKPARLWQTPCISKARTENDTTTYALYVVRSTPKITYAVLKLEAGVTVHKGTLYRLLKDEGTTNWLAKKRPLLNPEVVIQRLQWAKKHRNWTWDGWRKMIWSNECSLERGAGAVGSGPACAM